MGEEGIENYSRKNSLRKKHCAEVRPEVTGDEAMEFGGARHREALWSP